MVAIGVAVELFVIVAVAVVGYAYLTAPETQRGMKDIGRRIEEGWSTPSEDEEPFSEAEPDGTEPCPLEEPGGGGGPQSEPPPPEPSPPGGAPDPTLPIIGVLIGIVGSATSPKLHKPVIPGQQYTDQTCDDAMLQQLHSEKDRKCKSIQTVQPPQKPYSDPTGKDANKQKRLCQNLKQKEQDLKDCLAARQDVQDQCFDSPKNTADEQARDAAHQDQVAQLQRALAKTQADIAKFGC